MKSILCFIIVLFGFNSQADTNLSISTNDRPTAFDPHYADISLDQNFLKYTFSTLYSKNKNLSFSNSDGSLDLHGLVETDQQETPTRWVLTLRPGVKFHDGSSLTSSDIKCSLDRVRSFQNLSLKKGYFPSIEVFNKVETPSANTVVLEADIPLPQYNLRSRLSEIGILSCEAAQFLEKEQIDFEIKLSQKLTKFDSENKMNTDSSKKITERKALEDDLRKAYLKHTEVMMVETHTDLLMNGTGPYKFISWTPMVNDSLQRLGVFKSLRFSNYYGPMPSWNTVDISPVLSSNKRYQGLVDGQYDIVTQVPSDRYNSSTDGQINTDGVRVAGASGTRPFWLHMYQKDDGRHKSTASNLFEPITDQNGIALPEIYQTVFFQPEMRKALQLSIDRNKVANAVGIAVPSNQMIAEGTLHYDESVEGVDADILQAQQLWLGIQNNPAFPLFKEPIIVPMHGVSDRYPLAKEAVEEIARQVTAALPGITVKTFFEPKNRYFGNASNYLISFMSWGSHTTLQDLVASQLVEGGSYNYGNIFSPIIEAANNNALSSTDSLVRKENFQIAQKEALENTCVVPLYTQLNIWGARPEINFEPRKDEKIFATEIELN